MKKIVAFICCFTGGSLFFFVLSLAGCRQQQTNMIYQSVTSVVREGRDNEEGNEVMPGATSRYDRCSVWLYFSTTKLLGTHFPSFTNTAAARGQTFRNLEKITDIRIITCRDYNAQFPAGSDISASAAFLEEGGILTGKAKMLERINKNYEVSEAEPVSRFSFRPASAPATTSLQQFAIELRTEQNAVLRDTTIAFILQP
ncbi:hypothetical protein [Taibaiella koreensis]|uniref:hypothetical protein n=1 Tax=Taibaiella koreensis TaxID=1268548 RepID=UPI000E59DB02|nr:hypothetical protein [Taibaiella koreensis]